MDNYSGNNNSISNNAQLLLLADVSLELSRKWKQEKLLIAAYFLPARHVCPESVGIWTSAPAGNLPS